MKNNKMFGRRYAYLSHMIDASGEAVMRVIKISAAWATISMAFVFVNLAVYMVNHVISPVVMLCLAFVFWSAIFGTMMYMSLSWIAYLATISMTDDSEDYQEDAPTPPKNVTRVYQVEGRRTRLMSEKADSSSGVGELTK